MSHPVFQPKEDTICDICGHDLAWLRVILCDGDESLLRDCHSCRWYEASALFTSPVEAYRKKIKNNSDAEIWALRVARATGSAVELRRSPRVIEDDESNSIHELDLMAWLERPFHDSEEMDLIHPPRMLLFRQWWRRLREWWTTDETLGGVCTAKYIPYPNDQARIDRFHFLDD
jgi:hypothetical protein